MLQEERFAFILKELAEKGAVKVNTLAEQLHTSQSTIRRDIRELDESGKLRKVFGGAVALEPSVNTIESDVLTRESRNTAAKDAIARYAATQINENDFVYIDAGTTTERIIPYIDSSLTGSVYFVTNGIMHARRLVERGFRVFLPGGVLKATTEAIVGAGAMEYIDNCNFTKCFMGTNGVDPSRGFTTPEMDEARIKAQAIRHSYITYVLCDSSKFDNVSSVSFGKLNCACIVTDRLPNEIYRNITVIKEVEA